MTDTSSNIHDHLARFYRALSRVPKYRLEVIEKENIPDYGVYFFFEDGEMYADDTPRVVRVGTHAVAGSSKREMKERLADHRGKSSEPECGGYHRKSIFRSLVGSALINKYSSEEHLIIARSSWGRGSSPQKALEKDTSLLSKDRILRLERVLECKVSRHLAAMEVLVVAVGDDKSLQKGQEARKRIETQSLRLLSRACCTSPASPNWLGHHSDRKLVRCSGLWNQQDLDGDYCPDFLKEFQNCVEDTNHRFPAKP